MNCSAMAKSRVTGAATGTQTATSQYPLTGTDMMLLWKDHAVASKLDSQNAVNGSVDGENRGWDRRLRKSG